MMNRHFKIIRRWRNMSTTDEIHGSFEKAINVFKKFCSIGTAEQIVLMAFIEGEWEFICSNENKGVDCSKEKYRKYLEHPESKFDFTIHEKQDSIYDMGIAFFHSTREEAVEKLKSIDRVLFPGTLTLRIKFDKKWEVFTSLPPVVKMDYGKSELQCRVEALEKEVEALKSNIETQGQRLFLCNDEELSRNLNTYFIWDGEDTFRSKCGKVMFTGSLHTFTYSDAYGFKCNMTLQNCFDLYRVKYLK